MEEQLTTKGFYDLWIEQMRKGFGCTAAYNNAEVIHYNRYGKFRYASYDSFRASRPK